MRNRDTSNNEVQSSQPTPETVVGASLKIEGDLKSEGNIRIDGEVRGSVSTTGNVYIGKEAIVEASVEASNAEIAGRVTGDVSVQKRLELQGTARLNGNTNSAELVVQQGAQFNGTSSMGGADKKLFVETKHKQPALVSS